MDTKDRSKQKPQTEYRQANDAAWKAILSLHLVDFTAFFWPMAYRLIDWSIPYVALEQELLKLTSTAAVNNTYVDKLFKVFLKNGSEQWLLLHVEIQHSKQEDFARRMLRYYARMLVEYDKQIASIAILADNNRSR